MRARIITLSLVTLLVSALSAGRASAATTTTLCDEAGNCGSCCTSAAECIAWCNAECSSSSCPLTSNPMCCGAGGFSIECGRVS
jgi:hypothetical protein